MKKSSLLKVLLFCVALLFFTNCAKIKKWREDIKRKTDIMFKIPQRAVITALPLEDFPPPLDFYLLKNESWAYKDGSNLYAKILYRGNGKISLVTNFYTNILEKNGWNIQDQKVVENYTYMKFINNNNKHTAEFVIKSIPNGTLVTIYIKPM